MEVDHSVVPRIPMWRWTAVLLIEGYVSVSLQMIALRQVVPFVGSSIAVTSIVITTFLLALAFGYRSGGRRSRQVAARVVRNLLWSGLLMSVGLSIAIVSAYFQLARFLSWHPLVSVAVYTVVFVAPVVFLLAETVVVLVEARKGGLASEKAGETFLLSTMGNVVGGLFTTLVIMYFFGVGASIALCVLLLVVASLVWSLSFPISQGRFASAAIAGLACACTASLVISAENDAYDRTTAFASYAVREAKTSQNDVRYLFNNGQNASRTDSNGIGHAYIESFEDRIESRFIEPEILVLGAGGFTLGQGRVFGETRFVDIDPALEALGERFLQAKLPGAYIVSDARAYLIDAQEEADVVVVDTFSDRSAVPSHLLTQEFFALVRGVTKEGGLILMNFIASDSDLIYRRSLDNTIRSVLSDCEIDRLRNPLTEAYNLVYECVRQPDVASSRVFVDGSTRAAIDSVAF